MTTILCTLYNSLYLDKGLVLYNSLCECSKDFRLYVLCMDDKCYEVLSHLNLKNHVPVMLSDFEKGDEELLIAKSNRPIGEYCWTCSSSFIKYVLVHYGEESCTYIDADMYFYNDPQQLVDEMIESGKSVMVVPHRFSKKNEDLAKRVGTFCVEFNTFLNNTDGLEVLNYWRNRCIECCSNLGDGIHWGDQKYLEELVQKFDCVHVCMNNGAGIAPWNIDRYTLNNNNILFDKSEDCLIVFYHFQSVQYKSSTEVSVGIKSNLKNVDYALIDYLYAPYINKTEIVKNDLKLNHNLDVRIYHHPAKTNTIYRCVEFLQRFYIFRYLINIIHGKNRPYTIKIAI